MREELARILASAEFKAPPRRRHMLQYLVEELLAGREDEIKGYTVGVGALDKDEDFDPQSDPVVRFEARRLRQNLDGYYASDGRNDPFRITIPVGQYVPVIEPHHAVRGTDVAADSAPLSFMREVALPLSRRRWYIAAALLAGIAALAVSGLVTANYWGAGNVNEAPIQPPAIAMLPFEVLSTNEEDRFLAIGISNRVVGELRRFPDIRIFSPRLDPGQRSKSDLVALGNRLGVSHVIAGDLRSDDASVDVSARLIDVQTGEILWADSYSRSLDPGSLFAIQNEIAADIATMLGQPYGVIRTALSENLADQLVPTMPSYECVLRAYQYRRVLPGHELAGSVMDCLQKAVVEEPEYPEAWALLGFLYMDDVRFNRVPSADVKSTFAKATDAASRATALDPNNVTGLQALSAINFYQGNYAEGERFIRLALAQNPNDPETLVQAGWRMAIRGNFEEGVPLIERGIARSVNPPGWNYHLIALDRLMKGDGAGMLVAAEKSTLTKSPLSTAMVAMAHGLLGNKEAGLQTLKRMNEFRPNYDPIKVIRSHQATEEILQAATAALYRAGWTEPYQKPAL